MKFYIDNQSFKAPYLRAPDETKQAFLDAGRTVDGANARAEEARRALEDLLQFREKLIQVTRDKSFARLPRLRSSWLRRPIKHYHHLTVGVWRGIFLVAPDGSAAVGVVFSREPHDFLNRLDELRDRHANRAGWTAQSAAEQTKKGK